MDNIYFNTLIKKSVVVEPKYLTPQIDEYILKVLKKKYEGKCIHEGYVKEESIVIEKKSAGLLYGSHFTGEMTYTILFKAEVCNPVAGNIIEFEIQSKNQMCLRGVLGPMEIVIPREMVFDNPSELKLLDSYKVGDKIKTEVIKSRYFPNGTNIRVIAKVISLENSKNKNNKVSNNNKTFVSSETNIDDEEMPNAILEKINVEEESDSDNENMGNEDSDEETSSESDTEGMDDEDIELSDSDNEQYADDVDDAEGTKDVVLKNPNEEIVSDEEEEENYEEDIEAEEGPSDDEGGDDEY
jgi:DNA-directed RNA polymerase subunit E'/Rpb7